MVIVGIGRSFDMIVTITYFSYKRGLPEDNTGNGVSFVYDWPRFAAEAEVRDDLVGAISRRLSQPGRFRRIGFVSFPAHNIKITQDCVLH